MRYLVTVEPGGIRYVINVVIALIQVVIYIDATRVDLVTIVVVRNPIADLH